MEIKRKEKKEKKTRGKGRKKESSRRVVGHTIKPDIQPGGRKEREGKKRKRKRREERGTDRGEREGGACEHLNSGKGGAAITHKCRNYWQSHKLDSDDRYN